MQVRVGLTLLLCAVLLSSGSASSGQYQPPRAEGPEPSPPGLHLPTGRPGLGLCSPFTPRSGLSLALFLGFCCPGSVGLFGELEGEGEKGQPTPVHTSLPRSKLYATSWGRAMDYVGFTPPADLDLPRPLTPTRASSTLVQIVCCFSCEALGLGFVISTSEAVTVGRAGPIEAKISGSVGLLNT